VRNLLLPGTPKIIGQISMAQVGGRRHIGVCVCVCVGR
jgi:hypothetical protein